MAALQRIHNKEGNGCFATVHVDGYPYGELEPIFITQFFHELGPELHLTDDYGNNHLVKFNQSWGEPLITEGWEQLRTCYHMTGHHIIVHQYCGDNIFHITVFPNTITPSSFPSFHSRSTRNSRCVSIIVELSKYTASGSQLTLPNFTIGRMLRAYDYDSVLLYGPSGGYTTCSLLLRDKPKMSTKIGMGWKQFCKENEMKAGQEFKLEFLDFTFNNIVKVTKI